MISNSFLEGYAIRCILLQQGLIAYSLHGTVLARYITHITHYSAKMFLHGVNQLIYDRQIACADVKLVSFISFNFIDEQSPVFDAYNPYSAFVAMNTITPLMTAATPGECVCH